MESNTTNSNQNQKPRHGWRIFLGIIVIIAAAIFWWIVKDGLLGTKQPAQTSEQNSGQNTNSPEAVSSVSSFGSTSVSSSVPSSVTNEDIPEATVIATGLKIPWDFAFLPDESMLVTERAGTLLHIQKDGTKTSIKLPHSVPKGEGGLLGITLHPDFVHNKYLYLYMMTQNLAKGTKNAVFRYRYSDGVTGSSGTSSTPVLSDEKIIIADIPGAIYHDGGRLEFGPDGMLYITTGDATTDAIAQDLKSLGGKILRLKDDGSIPADNPFGTAVYSYGHRNPQGLAWDPSGRMWETEHGRSGALTGMDEVNIIEKGKNYGWPTIEGDATKAGMVTPVLNSGPKVTWAPASALYFRNSIFYGGLLGETLYEAVLDGPRISELKSHFYKEYGRIRTVRLGPDGMMYFTTSNRDGRGKPVPEDDRIVRINPDKLSTAK